MNTKPAFSGPESSPQMILESRTRRAERQASMLRKGCPCLLSFTLNLPGARKQFPLAKAAFYAGMEELRRTFGRHILEEQILDAETGSEALLALDTPPSSAKEGAIELEDTHPLGRLFDIDVLDQSGRALSRSSFCFPPRRCLLCGREAKVCARARSHPPEALFEKVLQMLNDYFRGRFANRYAACAVQALLYEVSTTPKPGLVDRVNSGAHRDMDFFTFLDSSAVLSPWFREMFCCGWDHSAQPIRTLFSKLRFLGAQAEREMFRATKGVNTHKGLIFSLGLLCGALGYIQADHPDAISLDSVLSLCKELGRYSLEDLSGRHGGTPSNGIQCYQRFAVTGVRGEAAAGFPSARFIGLPSLQKWTSLGLCLNDAAAITLIALVSEVEDTNMIHRGGLAAAQECRSAAKKLLPQLRIDNFRLRLDELDLKFIQKNMSPGGCADLLAVSLMLFFLEKQKLVFLSDAANHADPVSRADGCLP